MIFRIPALQPFPSVARVSVRIIARAQRGDPMSAEQRIGACFALVPAPLIEPPLRIFLPFAGQLRRLHGQVVADGPSIEGERRRPGAVPCRALPIGVRFAAALERVADVAHGERRRLTRRWRARSITCSC